MYEEGPDMTSLTVQIGNPDGIAGYTHEGAGEHAQADLYVNGVSKGQIEIIGSGDHAFAGSAPMARIGDTVKVVFHIDPARTDYDQTDVQDEVTVVPFS